MKLTLVSVLLCFCLNTLYAFRFDKPHNTVSLSDSMVLKKVDKVLPKIYMLNDEGILKLDTFALYIRLKEKPNNRYDLKLKSGGRLIIDWKDISGISKIHIHPYFVFLTVYDTFTEDGANEGYAFLYDWHNDSRTISKRKFKNTCNPIYYGDGFYMIENMSLVKTDYNFNVRKRTPIVFHNQKNNTNYLDTYLIGALAVEKDNLQISFSPQKSTVSQQVYSGEFLDTAKKIILTN